MATKGFLGFSKFFPEVSDDIDRELGFIIPRRGDKYGNVNLKRTGQLPLGCGIPIERVLLKDSTWLLELIPSVNLSDRFVFCVDLARRISAKGMDFSPLGNYARFNPGITGVLEPLKYEEASVVQEVIDEKKFGGYVLGYNERETRAMAKRNRLDICPFLGLIKDEKNVNSRIQDKGRVSDIYCGRDFLHYLRETQRDPQSYENKNIFEISRIPFKVFEFYCNHEVGRKICKRTLKEWRALHARVS